jgi:lipopolysaccharide/colanic/teichoic acid biosynthesis glycosyltransferase
MALTLPASLIAVPVAAVVAVMVRVRLGSPILFRQERSGQGGSVITVPKFRSMTNARSPDGTLLPDGQRLTSFGRWIRRSSLDELPQLWSVLRGDMSLVGPRPLPCAYLHLYSEEQRRRLEAKPGITGYAQVNGRNATSWPERLRQDVWYVDNASVLVDLKILMATVKTALHRGNVSAEGHATMPEFRGER